MRAQPLGFGVDQQGDLLALLLGQGIARDQLAGALDGESGVRIFVRYEVHGLLVALARRLLDTQVAGAPPSG